MEIGFLIIAITLAGIVFVATCMSIIILGKRVGERKSGQQRIIVGKYVDISTNSVLTLLIITVFFALAPLALIAWKPELLSLDISKYTNISIYGQVTTLDGSPVEGALIKVVKTINDTSDTLNIKKISGQQGEFSFILKNAKPDDEFQLILFARGGYKDIKTFGFNKQFTQFKLNPNSN